MKRRKVAVILGSDENLGQCCQGLALLKKAILDNTIEFKGVVTASVKSDIGAVFAHLTNLAATECDVIIVDAVMANQCDSFLRYTLRNDKVVVIGMVFMNKNSKRAIADTLNMTEAQDSFVVFEKEYVGENGFLKTCSVAISGNLPRMIIRECAAIKDRNMAEAIKEAERFKKGE